VIDKEKIYEIFGEMRKLAGRENILAIVLKNSIIEKIALDIAMCDRLEKDFLETRKIKGFSICEISEIFTIGKAIFEFQRPSAGEVRSAAIINFRHRDSIIFQVKDEDGFLSLYYYRKKDIGDPNEIKANHNSIYFENGRCFYTSYIKSILPVEKILLN